MMVRKWPSNRREVSLFHIINYAAAVTVGFDQTVYTVSESDGEVILNVAVLSGQLSSDFVVRVDTMPSSAEGKAALIFSESD